MMSIKHAGFVAGPLLAGIVLLIPAGDLDVPARITGALMVWMAIWWTTEPVPIPATSLLPLIVLPLAGVATPKAVAASYSHHIILLLLGGFIMALAIERWKLHKRIALNIVSMTGTTPSALIAGFMVATACLSMWISNTATTLMMVPIAMSAAAVVKNGRERLIAALLPGICYAASIGGVATPVGTPTNLIAIDWMQRETGTTTGFAQWMAFGLPVVCVMVPAAWWSVTRNLGPAAPGSQAALDEVNRQRRAAGVMSIAERRVAIIGALIAVLWITRLWLVEFLSSRGWDTLDRYSGSQIDMMIAVAGAVLVFVVPAGGGLKRALLNWDEAIALPWGVLLLFGGGLALGQAVQDTGLATWIGNGLGIVSTLPDFILIAIVVTLVIFLTELTSNVATITTLAPILGGLAIAVGVAPASLMAPAAIAASCAFMLPVATAPNAIVYATGQITIRQMVRHGLRINLIGIVAITMLGYWLLPHTL